MSGARALGKILVLASVLVASGAQGARPEGDRPLRIASDDVEMEAAINKAQSTLDGFLVIAAKPPVGTEAFKLKVAITDGVHVEHFWIRPFHAIDGGFEGTVNNKPDLVHTVKLGQVIRFTRDDVSDWGYMKAGHQVGSFTVCAMFKHLPKEEVDYYRTSYGFDC
ncbi:MAG: YegJ family protein [Massilia sp.]